MGSFPWGPHGPETSPNQVKPNPTAADPVVPIGQPHWNVTQTTSGYTGGGSGGPFLSIALSLMMVPLVWMFWICLYPLTAAASIVTGFVTGSLARRAVTASDAASVAQLTGVIAGFVAAVIVGRVEYKLAQNTGLRLARHALRLMLFAALALPWIQAMIGDAKVAGSSTRYIFVALSNPRFLVSQLMNPPSLAIVVAVMVGMHFLLWKAERLRAFWHRRLFWLGLK